MVAVVEELARTAFEIAGPNAVDAGKIVGVSKRDLAVEGEKVACAPALWSTQFAVVEELGKGDVVLRGRLHQDALVGVGSSPEFAIVEELARTLSRKRSREDLLSGRKGHGQGRPCWALEVRQWGDWRCSSGALP